MRLLTVLWIVVKQIVRNWRLELGLLLGLVMAVAIVSAVPIYTNGALQYSLMRDWVKSTSRGRLPYTLFLLNDPGMEGDVDLAKYRRLMDFLEEVEDRIGAPLLYYSRIGTVDTRGIRPVDPELMKKEQYGNLRYMSGLEDRVDVIEGRWPTALPREDGVLEVIVDEKALDSKELLVGRQYVMKLAATSDYDREMKTITAEVVGVFRPKEETKGSPVWAYYPPFENSFFISEEFLQDHLMQMEGVAVYELVWYWVFDHTDVYVDQLSDLIADLEYLENTANQILPGTRLWLSPLTIFKYFRGKAFYLRFLMFVLSIPILGMVLYFIVLAASLTVGRRQTEIAMLRSRGASAGQIVFSYLIEWLILGIAAFAIGPWLGLLISKVIGASAGFLSFVDRTGLPVRLGREAYRYALIGGITAVLACLIPVISATRHSIVTYKQEMVRKSQAPVWQRYYLDFLLAGLVFLGYRSLQRQALLVTTAQDVTQSQLILDPALFVIPVLFLVAAALIALRLYPWLMRFLAWATDRWAGIALSLTTLHLERNPGQCSPLILLIILTVSMGIYGASTARTLDKNFADQLTYRYGSDVVLREQWALPGGGGSMGAGMSLGATAGAAEEAEVTIYEPPFYIHKELPGVEAAARVQRLEVNVRSAGQFRGRANLMAVDPWDFAKTAWTRPDLNEYHMYAYLNALTTHYEGVLASRELVERYRVRVGDWVTLALGGQDIDFYVVGVVDYWPTLYPDKQPFFVGNLNYLQDEYLIQPYDVWLKVNGKANLTDIVTSLREQGIWVVGIDDVRGMLIEGRQEPQRMGLFGMLSIGFLVSVVISLMGFFFYTFLSLRQRFLQFGVLRAIGLSVGQLISMLFVEQLLSVGVAVGIGTVLGGWASRLFLPFTKVSADLTGLVPEFMIIVSSSDLNKIYLTLGGMLLFGLIGLVVILSRMRLHQAVKLGEEV
ncbi:MAG: hypothetical protein GX998_05010 [Firmicutes bacterium]|nr:hypothetical protein [Bacillota bacterium]